MTTTEEDRQVIETDVLVVGAGAGGMVAALTARVAGLDVLLVEKAPQFGGTSSSSGAAVWVPGARVQKDGGCYLDMDEVSGYFKTLVDGDASEERITAYLQTGPEMLDFLSEHSPVKWLWQKGYPDYYSALPGGSDLGSSINVEPMDARMLGDDYNKLLPTVDLQPKGMWYHPMELIDLFTVRYSWAGVRVAAKGASRWLKSKVTGGRGKRVITHGEALCSYLWLGLKRYDTKVWLGSPMASLISDEAGNVVGAMVRRNGREVEVRARGGVILACGGFEHNTAMRKKYQPFVEKQLSWGTPGNAGDGIIAGQSVGADVALMDEAWWMPTVLMPDGTKHFLINERMMPEQIIVNGNGERFINEATPYSEFGQTVFRGQASGVQHIPCWLITDDHAWRRYVIGGHLPFPKIPFAPVPTGLGMVQEWIDSGTVRVGQSLDELATQINVPADNLRATIERYNSMAVEGKDLDFGRGDSAYDRYSGDRTLPNPSLAPLHGAPYYAFPIEIGDLGTNGGLLTDEFGRVLREDGSTISGLFGIGNTVASVMGRSYAGAGATLGPAMIFGYIAAKFIADKPTSGNRVPDSTGHQLR